ncbi:MAG TPA: methyltransferase [Rhodothermales bacterium]|nr:methyltransferase [Rhodothermales bacterium]
MALALAAFWLLHLRCASLLSRTPEGRWLGTGQAYDPQVGRWIPPLFCLDWAGLLVPGRPGLTVTGLVIVAAALAALWRVDSRLAANFGGEPGGLMTDGAYGLVRHPRYACLLLVRVGLLVAYPSPVTLLALCLWAALVARRIRLEERCLSRWYGAEYRAYCLTTARIIPFVL